MKSIKKPLVSVIITTRNSAFTMEDLLKSIKNQSYPNIEIVVVDNNSSDETVAISQKYTNKVFQKGPERSAQRNYAAKMAKGDFYLILDSDMVLTKEVVTECVKKFMGDDKKLGCLVIPERSFGTSFWAKAKILEREINEGEIFFESARFFPKKIFWEFKGYDENITGPEDWDLPQRISKKYYRDRVKSYILHNEGDLTLTTLYQKKFYYGLSADKYLRKQKLSIIGPTTIYLLRPAFYKNWPKLLKNPPLTLGMLIMLTVELVGGGLGYLQGKFRNV